MGLLIPEVFIIILTDITAALLLAYVSFSAFRIYSGWNTSQSGIRYELEKRRVLASVVVKFVFILKIPLFLFFIYTNDKLSNVLTGAMCAAGSVNATAYGEPLLYLKILNIFLISIWLTLQHNSSLREKLPYTKAIYGYLLVIIILISAETVLGILNFTAIDPAAVVSCCSSLYSSSSEGSVLRAIDPFTGYLVFLIISLFYTVSLSASKIKTAALLSVLFFFSGVISLTVFTSSYVYQLPSHKCPFCLLQKEYFHIGYLFYISLFMSAAGGLNLYFYKKVTGNISGRIIKTALFFAIVYILLSLLYPVRYYLMNGTWL